MLLIKHGTMTGSRIEGLPLHIIVLGCSNLRKTNDAYVCLEYATETFRSKTSNINGNKNPRFGDKVTFSLKEGLGYIDLIVYNSNIFSSDAIIGKGKISLHKVLSSRIDDNISKIYDKDHKYTGEVNVMMYYQRREVGECSSTPVTPQIIAPSAPSPPYIYFTPEHSPPPPYSYVPTYTNYMPPNPSCGSYESSHASPEYPCCAPQINFYRSHQYPRHHGPPQGYTHNTPLNRSHGSYREQPPYAPQNPPHELYRHPPQPPPPNWNQPNNHEGYYRQPPGGF